MFRCCCRELSSGAGHLDLRPCSSFTATVVTVVVMTGDGGETLSRKAVRHNMIGPTVHHIDSRQTCAGCRTRVFTYADEIDASGTVLRHFCARCARLARGEPVCRICGEEIIDTTPGWRHVNQQRRHPVTPLLARVTRSSDASWPVHHRAFRPERRAEGDVPAGYWRSARIPNVRHSYSDSLSGPCPHKAGTSRWFRLDRSDFRSSLQNPPIPRRGSG